jgi:hypothetical protein
MSAFTPNPRLNINLVLPEDPLTRHFRLQEEDDAKPGFFQTAVAAVEQEHLLTAGLRSLRRLMAPTDLDFSGFHELPDNEKKKITEGIPEDMQDQLWEARSLIELEAMADETRALIQSRALLDQAGWMGFAAQVGAALLDPVALGIGIGTGGFGTFLAKAKTIKTLTGLSSGISRARIVAGSGLVAGLENAGIEGLLLIDNPTKNASDMLFALIGGGFLGAAGGALTSRTYAKVQRAANRTLEHLIALDADDIAKRAGLTLTQRGSAFFAKYAGSDKGKELFVNMVTNSGVSPQDLKYYTEILDSGDTDLNAAFGALVGKYPEAPFATSIGLSAAEAVQRSLDQPGVKTFSSIKEMNAWAVSIGGLEIKGGARMVQDRYPWGRAMSPRLTGYSGFRTHLRVSRKLWTAKALPLR